jgi:hypothetical protein
MDENHDNNRESFEHNTLKLLGRLQVVAFHAASLAESILESVKPLELSSSASNTKLVEVGLQLVQASTATFEVTTRIGREILR